MAASSDNSYLITGKVCPPRLPMQQFPAGFCDGLLPTTLESLLWESSGQDKQAGGSSVCALTFQASLWLTTDDLLAPSVVGLPYYFCNFCDYHTDRRGHLLQHVVGQHVFRCGSCDFVSVGRYDLVQHQLHAHLDNLETQPVLGCKKVHLNMPSLQRRWNNSLPIDRTSDSISSSNSERMSDWVSSSNSEPNETELVGLSQKGQKIINSSDLAEQSKSEAESYVFSVTSGAQEMSSKRTDQQNNLKRRWSPDTQVENLDFSPKWFKSEHVDGESINSCCQQDSPDHMPHFLNESDSSVTSSCNPDDILHKSVRLEGGESVEKSTSKGQKELGQDSDPVHKLVSFLTEPSIVLEQQSGQVDVSNESSFLPEVLKSFNEESEIEKVTAEVKVETPELPESILSSTAEHFYLSNIMDLREGKSSDKSSDTKIPGKESEKNTKIKDCHGDNLRNLRNGDLMKSSMQFQSMTNCCTTPKCFKNNQAKTSDTKSLDKQNSDEMWTCLETAERGNLSESLSQNHSRLMMKAHGCGTHKEGQLAFLKSPSSSGMMYKYTLLRELLTGNSKTVESSNTIHADFMTKKMNHSYPSAETEDDNLFPEENNCQPGLPGASPISKSASSSELTLRELLTLGSKDSPASFMCQKCGLKLSSRAKLDQHSKTCHYADHTLDPDSDTEIITLHNSVPSLNLCLEEINCVRRFSDSSLSTFEKKMHSSGEGRVQTKMSLRELENTNQGSVADAVSTFNPDLFCNIKPDPDDCCDQCMSPQCLCAEDVKPGLRSTLCDIIGDAYDEACSSVTSCEETGFDVYDPKQTPISKKSNFSEKFKERGAEQPVKYYSCLHCDFIADLRAGMGHHLATNHTNLIPFATSVTELQKRKSFYFCQGQSSTCSFVSSDGGEVFHHIKTCNYPHLDGNFDNSLVHDSSLALLSIQEAFKDIRQIGKLLHCLRCTFSATSFRIAVRHITDSHGNAALGVLFVDGSAGQESRLSMVCLTCISSISFQDWATHACRRHPKQEPQDLDDSCSAEGVSGQEGFGAVTDLSTLDLESTNQDDLQSNIPRFESLELLNKNSRTNDIQNNFQLHQATVESDMIPSSDINLPSLDLSSTHHVEQSNIPKFELFELLNARIGNNNIQNNLQLHQAIGESNMIPSSNIKHKLLGNRLDAEDIRIGPSKNDTGNFHVSHVNNLGIGEHRVGGRKLHDGLQKIISEPLQQCPKPVVGVTSESNRQRNILGDLFCSSKPAAGSEKQVSVLQSLLTTSSSHLPHQTHHTILSAPRPGFKMQQMGPNLQQAPGALRTQGCQPASTFLRNLNFHAASNALGRQQRFKVANTFGRSQEVQLIDNSFGNLLTPPPVSSALCRRKNQGLSKADTVSACTSPSLITIGNREFQSATPAASEALQGLLSKCSPSSQQQHHGTQLLQKLLLAGPQRKTQKSPVILPSAESVSSERHVQRPITSSRQTRTARTELPAVSQKPADTAEEDRREQPGSLLRTALLSPRLTNQTSELTSVLHHPEFSAYK